MILDPSEAAAERCDRRGAASKWATKSAAAAISSIRTFALADPGAGAGVVPPWSCVRFPSGMIRD